MFGEVVRHHPSSVLVNWRAILLAPDILQYHSLPGFRYDTLCIKVQYVHGFDTANVLFAKGYFTFPY